MKNSISKLGFGLMRLPQLNDGSIDMTHFIEMIDMYISEGMNYFDTSFGYHNGQSEIAFRKAVSTRYSRDLYYLADKMPIWKLKDSKELDAIFRMQLRKTGVDYFDNYLIHALNGKLYKKCLDFKVFDFIKKMKKEGKLNAFGFSYHGSFEDYVMILNNQDVDFVQLQINYFDCEEGESQKFYEYTRNKNIPIIVMEPIRGGLLANPPIETENIFKKLNFKNSYASLALRYVLSLSGIITVLSGMSHIDQLSDNINTVKYFNYISEKEEEMIKAAAKSLKKHSTILCTSCNYCRGCPAAIPIYDVFTVYNKYLANKNTDEFKKRIDLITNAEKCKSCNYCCTLCPQQIDIPNALKNIITAMQSLA